MLLYLLLCIPGADRLNGFCVRSGQSTTLTLTVTKFFPRPSDKTEKEITTHHKHENHVLYVWICKKWENLFKTTFNIL
jgi:hypothetical protein